jgi:membrane-associated phospholipid phosphatase
MVVVDDGIYRRLLIRSAAALLLGAALVALCYFFVDRPVAFFVHDHGINRSPLLRDLTYPPAYLLNGSPLVLACLAVRRIGGPFRRWELALAVAFLSLPLAEQFRDSISFLAGRYWPDTWIENNPSLIHDGAYGFHPFHWGSAYGSFPSGHTARAVAFVAVFWIAYPAWRWLCVLVTAAVAVGLIGMNYHFISDVIAGGVVGGIVGAYLAHFAGLAAPA